MCARARLCAFVCVPRHRTATLLTVNSAGGDEGVRLGACLGRRRWLGRLCTADHRTARRTARRTIAARCRSPRGCVSVRSACALRRDLPPSVTRTTLVTHSSSSSAAPRVRGVAPTWQRPSTSRTHERYSRDQSVCYPGRYARACEASWPQAGIAPRYGPNMEDRVAKMHKLYKRSPTMTTTT